MSNRLPRRLRHLIALALSEGWRVEIHPDLHLIMRKPGFRSIHTGCRANDTRLMAEPCTHGDEAEHG